MKATRYAAKSMAAVPAKRGSFVKYADYEQIAMRLEWCEAMLRDLTGPLGVDMPSRIEHRINQYFETHRGEMRHDQS